MSISRKRPFSSTKRNIAVFEPLDWVTSKFGMLKLVESFKMEPILNFIGYSRTKATGYSNIGWFIATNSLKQLCIGKL